MSVNQHRTWKGFQKTLHSSIEAKLYQYELRAILAVFLPKCKEIALCRAEL